MEIKKEAQCSSTFFSYQIYLGKLNSNSLGGPGKGTVSDLPASQWRSYLDVADHPEYPSGSAAFCSTIALTSRLFYGDDNLGYSYKFLKGSSYVEPGITPP